MTPNRTDRIFTGVDRDAARPGGEERAAILIVDDRADNLLALEGILKDLGQNIVKASSGQEALKVAFNHDFAVILLDVRMPEMDGFETAELLRRRKRSAHTPIIFVTAVDETQRHVAQGYAAGAVDYIFKPLMPEVLKAKIGVFIELYKKRRLLERSESRYRALVENIPGAIYQSTAEFPRRMQFISDPIESMTGYSAAEFVAGRTLLDVVHPDDRAIVREMVENALREKLPYAMDYRILAKDGQVRWVFDKGQAILSEDGRVLCFDGLIFDITDRKKAERSLRERTLELEARNKELDAFSYSVSHDLRAPLRAIHRFTEILMTEELEGKCPPAAQESLKRILDASAHMDVLIEDLLEYSRLTRAEIALQPVDMSALIAEVTGRMASALQERKAEVAVRDCPPMVGDPVLLSQVLTNLLTNAVKFVPPGTAPRVVLRGERRGKVSRLWVEDNGIGIEPEYQERIFRVFERLHQRDTYPGTGIGLAIVQRAMERMDGKVGVESAPGKGSRFWIELPAAEARR